MSLVDENAMYWDHLNRAGDLAIDVVLARAVICRHARSTGRAFHSLTAGASE